MLSPDPAPVDGVPGGVRLTPIHRFRLLAALVAGFVAMMTAVGLFHERLRLAEGIRDEPAAPTGDGEAAPAPATDPELPPGTGFRNRNPFGITRIHPPPAPPVPVQPPAAGTGSGIVPPALPLAPSRIPLDLIGTIAAGPSGQALVRRASGGHDTALRIGEDLGRLLGDVWKGVQLASVTRASVRFEGRGQQWVLTLAEPATTIAAAAIAPASPAVPAAPASPLPEPEDPEAIRPLARSEVDAALANPAQVVNQMTIAPFFVQGRPAGLRVSRMRPDSILSRIGLRNGDVLCGVDDTQILEPRDAGILLERARQDGALSLRVLRDGATRTLRYEIR